MPDTSVENLLEIMRRLRAPEGGCPWDLEQDFDSIAPYTIEESYEVADAIAARDWEGLKDELGDVLFQVVFHAQMAAEAGYFDFSDVVDAISTKMVRRHPHVFGDAEIADAEAQTVAWEEHKRAERQAKTGGDGERTSVFDGVPVGLAALTRAVKLSGRAAKVGFDWDNVGQVLAKIDEETAELDEELAKPLEDSERLKRIEQELGDVLCGYANLARHLKIDPEAALRGTNRRFVERFQWIENRLSAEGRVPQEAALAELETMWQQAKCELDNK